MALPITKASDPIEIGTLITLIYGQPGIGKTSIAGTAENCLLLDFDRGSHRSAYRPDSFRMENWSQVANLTREDLAGYKTIAIDTVGRALDTLVASMPSSEGKTQLKRSTGDPTLQGYGWIKGVFAAWIKRVRDLGLDVILLCHDKEDKDGDSRIVRPDVMGGSYGEVVRMADFVGYAYMDGAEKILDFNPTSWRIGKASSNIGRLKIPHFTENGKWFSEVTADMKKSMGDVSFAQQEAVKKLSGFKLLMEDLSRNPNPNEWNDAKKQIAKWDKPIRMQAWRMMTSAARSCGLSVDSQGVFSEAQEEAQA